MDLKLLETLTQTFGPSGYEGEIRAAIRAEVEPLSDDLYVDRLGSLVIHRHSKNPQAKKLLLAAHMDEIGLMVTHIEEKGFLRFTNIGGLYPLHHIGGRVRFANGTVGTIYVERREDRTKSPQLKHLYIDVGATSREDSPVAVGDPGVFIGPLVQQNGRLISKTMDDRIGCYVLIELLRQVQEPAYDLYVVFSTQEEVTLAGARTSAYRIAPDIAIAVDVTLTGDTPKALPMAVELGKGPAIKVKDSGMIAHPAVRQMLIDAAEKAELPYQLEVLQGGTTDAMAMQLAREGIPSGCLSVPSRFVHSPSEMVDEADVENAIKLLLTAVETT